MPARVRGLSPGSHTESGRPLITVAGSGGVAGELPKPAVAPAGLVNAVLAAVGRLGSAGPGKEPAA